MKIWVDDVRPAPDDTWIHLKSVNEAIHLLEQVEFAYMVNAGFLNGFTGDSSDPEAVENLAEAKDLMKAYTVDIISLDHDAGEYASEGGDYIKILDYLESSHLNIPKAFHIHSMNPVGVANMRAIITKNNWREVYEIE